MKIVFFGTSEFGLPSLEALDTSNHAIAAIVTTPDKPQGRNLKLTASPIKQWALARNLKILEASKKNILTLEEELKKIDADVFVVISFGVILPKQILELPHIVSLNVHSSLLPLYRGPGPIHWALLNGDSKTGVTVMRMAEGLDTGDILLSQDTAISPDEDEAQLHTRLANIGAEILLKSLELLADKREKFTPQDEKKATYARKITKDDGRISWSESAQVTHNRVRALVRWPGAFTFFKDKRIIVRKTSLAAEKISTKVPGQILAASTQEGILVSTSEGVLCIEELQMEGRNRLTAAQFLSGFPLKVGDVLE